MSPAPITQDAAASASPPQQQSTPQAIAPSAQPVSRHFDDIFHAKFMQVIADWKNDPSRGSLTQKDRKTFIENAYNETDELYFSRRQLSDQEIKLRALTKVFYKILAEEPWSEDWIRAPDVERKLSRFEMHRDSVELAAKFNVPTPREAVRAAREAAAKQEEALKAATTEKEKEKLRIDRGPWDDIEIIYIPGTVSAAATSRLNRDDTYPISVSSVAATLQSHICRDMVRPFSMAERFVNCSDTRELEEMREFACNVCDYCPHLLDNDNVSLLVVLLILSRSDVCRRWENNGIRIEGSTISHRKSECMKNKLSWNTTELKKPFDNFASEFQTRVKNACFPAPRAQRGGGPKNKGSRKSSTPATPSTPTGYGPPPAWAYMPSPQIRQDGVNSGINIPTPAVHTIYKHPTGPGPDAIRQSTPGDAHRGDAGGPMDLSRVFTDAISYLSQEKDHSSTTATLPASKNLTIPAPWNSDERATVIDQGIQHLGRSFVRFLSDTNVVNRVVLDRSDDELLGTWERVGVPVGKLREGPPSCQDILSPERYYLWDDDIGGAEYECYFTENFAVPYEA